MDADRYRVGLLGHGIGPSLSPELHMAEARHLGLDYEYTTIDLVDRPDADLGDELRRLEDAGFVAANVTHPFKQAVLEHVQHRSAHVRRIGASNLVLLDAGRREGHNTDCTGFLAALRAFLPAGGARGTVLQVGAGGAGLATVAALLDLDFERIVVHDLRAEAVAAMIDRFHDAGHGRLRSSEGSTARWLAEVDGVVHVTPVGMAAHPGVAIDVDRLDRSAWVAEVVYRPLETELVRRARARGLATLDGGAMAVGQAADSLRLITGMRPDLERMHDHFDRLVAAGR